MIVTENPTGRFKKDEVTYSIQKSEEQTNPEAIVEALAAGYEDLSLPQKRIQAKKTIAIHRERAEGAWFTESTTGIFVQTDERSLAIVARAIVSVIESPSFTIDNFKLVDGTFIVLDNVKILALFNAIQANTDALFLHEKELNVLIDAATTVAELKAITW